MQSAWGRADALCAARFAPCLLLLFEHNRNRLVQRRTDLNQLPFLVIALDHALQAFRAFLRGIGALLPREDLDTIMIFLLLAIDFNFDLNLLVGFNSGQLNGNGGHGFLSMVELSILVWYSAERTAQSAGSFAVRSALSAMRLAHSYFNASTGFASAALSA